MSRRRSDKPIDIHRYELLLRDRSNRVTGLIALLFASFILLISVTSDPPVPQNTIYHRSITIDSTRLVKTKRSYFITIHAGGERFELSGKLFPGMPEDSLTARLLRADQVEIWLTTLHERRLLGLRAPGLDIPPALGLNMFDNNRMWAHVLTATFFVASILLFIGADLRRWRNRLRKQWRKRSRK